MIAGLRPYPAYQHSGVEWLGRIPEHWRAVRAKWLFAKVERPSAPDDDVVTCFRDGTVTRRKNRRESGFTESLKELGYQGVRCGDLVIHAMDAFAGACGVSDSDGKSSPVYSVCTPRDTKTNPHYFASLVREMARNRWILALARGVRERSTDFRFPAFGNQVLPVPPTGEQDAIVRFLDDADRRIRRAISARKKQIALLEEQKQAVIHQAVTGQIDVRTCQPYPAYKDSGVNRLGRIPEHWAVRRLRSATDLRVSSVDKHSHEHEQSVRLCNYVDVYRNDYIRAQMTFMGATATADEVGRFRIEAGDVLITKDSESFDDIGVPALVLESDDDLVCGYHLALIRPRRGVLTGGFLFRLLQSSAIAYQFHIAANGVTRYGLSGGALKSIQLPLPSVAEQKAIARFLDQEMARIGAVTTQNRQAIPRLREYRTRVIADVVTGKLDVRDAAATLRERSPA